MKQELESYAARIAARIQLLGAEVDPEILQLPGGGLIATVLWLYAKTLASRKHSRWIASAPPVPQRAVPLRGCGGTVTTDMRARDFSWNQGSAGPSCITSRERDVPMQKTIS